MSSEVAGRRRRPGGAGRGRLHPVSARRPREGAGSGGGACGQRGNRRCGFRCRSCRGWRRGGSSVRCSRGRRAKRAGRGAARPPGRVERRIEPPVPEDRAAQAPRIRMFRVGDPGADPAFNLFARRPARAPAVAQGSQPVAEAAHVLLRQVPPPARQQHEAEERRRRAGLQNSRLLRMEPQAAAFQEGRDAGFRWLLLRLPGEKRSTPRRLPLSRLTPSSKHRARSASRS